jgi:hypothetical protein
MPMRVAKNTFMYEPVSDDVLVRRAVFAGQFVPEHYIAGDDTEDGAVEVDGAGAPMVGFGAAAANYKHNVGVPIAAQVQGSQARHDPVDLRLQHGDRRAAERRLSRREHGVRHRVRLGRNRARRYV